MNDTENKVNHKYWDLAVQALMMVAIVMSVIETAQIKELNVMERIKGLLL